MSQDTQQQEQQPIVLTQDEVAQLSALEAESNNLIFKLGANSALRKKLDEEDADTYQKIEEANREKNKLHNRIAKKYGITKADARIDFNSGTIV